MKHPNKDPMNSNPTIDCALPYLFFHSHSILPPGTGSCSPIRPGPIGESSRSNLSAKPPSSPMAFRCEISGQLHSTPVPDISRSGLQEVESLFTSFFLIRFGSCTVPCSRYFEERASGSRVLVYFFLIRLRDPRLRIPRFHDTVYFGKK